MTHYVIIVAGGSGKRMNASLPKQFIPINQKPIIFHTIEKFLAFDGSIHFIIALQEDMISLWENELKKTNLLFNHTISLAGEERFHTVKNALSHINKDGIVGIHDAVRPLVNLKTIENCVNSIENHTGVIPVVPVVDSIRELKEVNSIAVNRANYKAVQTPQYFNIKAIKQAYNTNYDAIFTDDASVYEQKFNTVHLVDGNEENIKITTQKDLVLAKHYLS